jgi:hypothetical protein
MQYDNIGLAIVGKVHDLFRAVPGHACAICWASSPETKAVTVEEQPSMRSTKPRRSSTLSGRPKDGSTGPSGSDWPLARPAHEAPAYASVM